MSRDQYVTAYKAGMAANVGDANPYAGQGMLADLWRSGYGAMLEQRIADGRRARESKS